MSKYCELTREYRGEVYDLSHIGNVCVVNEKGEIIHSVGDPQNITCYRSASKPIQALPVIARNIDKKYGLTEEECVIFSASHTGQKIHVDVIESIEKKAGLKESDMIMNPTWPQDEAHFIEVVKAGGGKRKIFHNCSGKHTALMLLQRELGGPVTDYWRPESLAQQEVMRTISLMSEYHDPKVSLDGCGVPVFSVPLQNLAISFKNLACIDTIKDEMYMQTAKRYVPTIHEHPLLIRGAGYICSVLNMDANIIAKGGANGVYGFGLKKQRLGVAFKLADGTESSWPAIVLQILRDLDALDPEEEKRIMELHPYDIYNDNQMLAGRRETSFKLK